MHQTYLSTPSDLYRVLEEERPRLVRLCTSWLGDPVAAEDVVQETMLVAWRKIGDLRDPDALQSWLSGIARNMSLRWLRQRGRESAIIQAPPETPDILSAIPSPFDFEVELDRADLARLLEQALALVPAETRSVLVQKYIADASNQAIANQLGISENVVAVRLHRGKLALRKVLATELQSDATALGILTADDTWQETRIWCTKCGQRRLLGRLNEREFILRCPDCNDEPESYHSQDIGPHLQESGYKTFRPALKQFSGMMHDLFQAAIVTGYSPCNMCGRLLPLKHTIAHYAPPSIRALRGMHVYCPDCQSGSYESLDGRALSLPQGRDFFQAHPRIHTLPQRTIERDGVPAVVIAFAGVNDPATFEVIVRDGTYETLSIHSSDD